MAINAHELVRSINWKNPCGTVTSVVTQVMGARYEARTVFELVTQIAGDKSCTKLSSLNRFHLEFAVFVNHCQEDSGL